MPVCVHVPHGHQGAIFQSQAGVLVRQSGHACFIAGLGQNVSELRIAIVFVGHVADEVRQFVAGVVAFEMHRIVQVVRRVHQPVRVKHHDGVNA